MRIAILTSFNEFNPGYSLTGIVRDQISMLLEAGHEPVLVVTDQYNDTKYPGPENCEVRKILPSAKLVDFQSRSEITREARELTIKSTAALAQGLHDIELVFSHDIVFLGWHLPYADAVKEASKQLKNVGLWLHWIHSIPSGNRDYWDIKSYGPRHKLVFPNATDAIRVAEQFRGELSDVRVVPHIKDPRSYQGFCAQALDIVDKMPSLLQADIVQILPASVDRLAAKRVLEVIRVFSWFKVFGYSVSLLCANQWATTKSRKECVSNYEFFAWNCNLARGGEFAFTSSMSDEYEAGISAEAIRNLFSISNLFLFPTREESFGLVVAEAGLSGALLVLNRSLQMQLEISGNRALYFDFGSYTHKFQPEDEQKYYKDIAQIIAGELSRDRALTQKTFFRQRNNWTALYTSHYLPLIGEALQA